MQCDRYDLPLDSWVDSYLSLPDGAALDDDTFEDVWSIHPEEFAIVNVYGPKPTPRWQASFLHDYSFSKVSHKSSDIGFTDEDPQEKQRAHTYLQNLLEWVNEHAHLNRYIKPEETYNGILINWYQDGNHYIGEHSDDETELVRGKPIYSFSFGQERDFRITSKKNAKIQLEEPLVLPMVNNSLLIMGGKMQTWYKHGVPKRLRAKKCRINITFRIFNE